MSQYTPDFIAQSFVKQYYEILSHSPSDLHKFYLADANFAFQEVSQNTDNVIGFEQIRDRVARLNLFGSVVDVTHGSIDAQRFETTKILVVVTGTFATSSAPSSTPRPFLNTFILVGTNNAYFVSNSVFRFLPTPTPVPAVNLSPSLISSIVSTPAVHDVSPVTSQPLPQRNATEILKSVIEVTPSHVSSTAASAVLGASHSSTSIVNEEEEVVREVEETQPEVTEKEEVLVESEEPPVEEEVQEVVKETGSELDREDEREEPVPTYDEVAVQSDHPAENVTETETETAAKTYLDIVKRLAAAENKTVANGNTPAYRVVRTVVTAPPSNEAAPTAVKGGGDVPSGSKNHRGTSTSGQQVYAVYIAPLPEGATEQVIAEAFSVFGNVVQVDFTRGRKYGFVKFDTPTAMQAALDYEEVFEVNGVRVQIEEKTSPKPKGDGFTRRKDRERVGGEKGEKSPRSGKSNEFNRKSNGRKEGGERGSANGKVNSNNNNNNHQQQTQTATSQVKSQRK